MMSFPLPGSRVRTVVAVLCSAVASATAADQIVSVGGSLTEIVYALGAERKLAGVDVTSLYPDSASKLPQVGYIRTLAAEGILSLKPDLLITTSEAGPTTTIQQLKDAGLAVEVVEEKHSLDGVEAKISSVAAALGHSPKGSELLANFDRQRKELAQYLQTQKQHPKVLFVMAMGASVMAAGKETAADAIIRIAGGTNAVTEYAKYRPINPEAIIAAAPEFILITKRTADSIGGVEGVLNQPGIANTPAGASKKVIVMDDMYLLGFGPRTAESALELAKKLQK